MMKQTAEWRGVYLFNTINKYKVSILWTLSIMALIIGVIIGKFKPFSDKGSGILVWFILNSALLAMLFSAVRKKRKYKIIFCIVSMLYITYKTVLRFI